VKTAERYIQSAENFLAASQKAGQSPHVVDACIATAQVYATLAVAVGLPDTHTQVEVRDVVATHGTNVR
jgi:hypothetical protein